MLGRLRSSKPHYARFRHGTFEVCKSGARHDFTDPYHLAVTLSWPSFVLAGLGALLLINFAFARLYLLEPGAIHNLPPGDFLHAMFFSMETLSTVGYGEMSPARPYGYAVACSEMVVGIGFVALLTGILFSRFSRSTPGILFAGDAVVTHHNGCPTLMIRVANARVSMLLDAHASLSVLLKEISAEGHVYRRYRDLPLICARLPAFPLTWTVMHPIDFSSPLYGYDAERLRADWARLFLSIEARDTKLGRNVQELADYDDQRILIGARYVDAMVYDDTGRPTADLAKLGSIECPQPIGNAV